MTRLAVKATQSVVEQGHTASWVYRSQEVNKNLAVVYHLLAPKKKQAGATVLKQKPKGKK